MSPQSLPNANRIVQWGVASKRRFALLHREDTIVYDRVSGAALQQHRALYFHRIASSSMHAQRLCALEGVGLSRFDCSGAPSRAHLRFPRVLPPHGRPERRWLLDAPFVEALVLILAVNPGPASRRAYGTKRRVARGDSRHVLCCAAVCMQGEHAFAAALACTPAQQKKS